MRKFLTSKQMVALFGVSYATLTNWRKGRGVSTPLLHAEGGGHGTECKFDIDDVRVWAKANNRKFAVTAHEAASIKPRRRGPLAGSQRGNVVNVTKVANVVNVAR